MTIVSFRRWRHHARVLVAGVAWAIPVVAGASPEVVATRGLPSSITAEYGEAVPLGPPALSGAFAIATRWGFEVRSPALADSFVVTSRFRTSGTIRSLAVHGLTAYLFAGSRGIVAVDLSDPADPRALGSLGNLGAVTLGAVSGAGDVLAVASDGHLVFIDVSGPGVMAPRFTQTYPDDREVRAIQSKADSFLVASERVSPTRRLFLTLYRFPSGAAQPELLREFSVPLQAPSDLAWSGDLAFVAAGNSGVTVVNVQTGATRSSSASGRFVRDLDVNDSLVVVTLSAAGLGKFRRAGATGDSLVSFTSESLLLEPTSVTLMADRAVISSQNVLTSEEPDEVALSAIEMRFLDFPGASSVSAETGRTRRVAVDGGYAYVADYTGGLRIFRAGGPDTSLVGVLPVSGFSRVVDLALDPPRKRAYLAAMTGGLQIVDVSDPSAPALLAAFPLLGQVSAVAVIDSGLVIVGRRGSSAGITMFDVTLPTAPVPRGAIDLPFQDPRAIAVKDTIAFVADALLGLVSVGIGNPDGPAIVGTPSGFGARDLHLSGNLLLVGTRSDGLQIVDVFQPTFPILRSTLSTPSIHGVTRSGNSAVVFLAENEALVVDIGDPYTPAPRGPIAVPGIARDGAWVGDTLLVAAAFSLERYLVSPSAVAVAPLQIALDPGVIPPRARISWTLTVEPSGPALYPALVGWNLYRDALPVPPAVNEPAGVRVNAALLPIEANETTDPGVPGGVPVRYRLEGFFADGSTRKLAEGTLQVSVAPFVGRAYPNPYTPGQDMVTVPFTISLSDPGTVEAAVHDIQGRVVRRIVTPTPQSGFGTVVWDGRDTSGHSVSSGIYFIRVRGPGVDQASRVVVVR